MESVIKSLNDLAINQRLDDDVNTQGYKDMERFDLEQQGRNKQRKNYY